MGCARNRVTVTRGACTCNYMWEGGWWADAAFIHYPSASGKTYCIVNTCNDSVKWFYLPNCPAVIELALIVCRYMCTVPRLIGHFHSPLWHSFHPHASVHTSLSLCVAHLLQSQSGRGVRPVLHWLALLVQT